MSKLAGKGVRVYPHGIEFKSDRRIRRRTRFVGEMMYERYQGRATRRGAKKSFSAASLKRLAFVFANSGVQLRSMVTLTYHAASEQWNDPV